jgi:hypothetical protein
LQSNSIVKQQIAAVPALDEIRSNPRVLVGLPRSTIAGLLLQSAVVQSALTAALATEDATEQPVATPANVEDRMLTAAEAAAMLRRAPSWIYRNAAHLPFVQKRDESGERIRCSERDIRRYLARR